MKCVQFFIAAAFVCVGVEANPGASEALILSFDGKGTAMSWDAGVMKALYERLKMDRVNEILFVGSSSGSIASAYFSCRGLNQAAIDDLQVQSKRFPKDVLDENVTGRAIKLILGVPAEISFDAVDPIINLATLNQTCVPKLPLLIAAGNLDVLEGRNNKPFSGRRDRKFNRDNYELSKNGAVLGKACTYFVNESMAKILAVVPEQERLCDLRFIRSAADLRMAIMASIAEPTYFAPPLESDMTKLVSVHKLPAQRTYGGGFVMNSAAQDVKRARPRAYVFGTGRASYSRMQNRALFNWFTFPMNETLLNQRWFFDEQVVITKSEWAELYEKKTTNANLIEMGYAKATACFNNGGCRPTLFQKPFYSKDAWDKPLDEWRGRGIKALF